MTTANISVGLDTGPAKAELVKLRQQMTAQPYQLAFNFNAKEIDNEIATYMRRKNFTVRLGDVNLQNVSKRMADQFYEDAHQAITRATRGHFVTFDHALLTTQVSAAVRAGLQGHILPVGAGVGSATGAASTAHVEGVPPSVHAALQRTLRETMLPAVEQMTKAALAIEGAAKKTSVARSAGSAGSASASIANSAKLADGSTVRHSLPLASTEVEAALLEIQGLNARKDVLKGTLAEAKGAEARVRLESEIEALDQRLRDATWDQLQAQQRLTKATEVSAAFQQAEARDKATAAASARNLGAQYGSVQKAEKQAGAAALSQGLASNKANLEEEATAAAKLNHEYDLMQAELDKINEGKRLIAAETARSSRLADDSDLKNQTGARQKYLDEQRRQAIGSLLQETDERQAILLARRQKEAMASLQASDEYKRALKSRQNDMERALQNEFGQYQANRAKMKAADDAVLASLKENYRLRKIMAADSYTGIGPSVVAARGMAATTTPELANRALGIDRVYLNPAINAEKYASTLNGKVAPAVKSTKEAQEALNGVMRDGHSAARGLAGSMGAMWATWGNVAPLVAAAALGTAIRRIVTVGKDLEYQLTFVSALTDNATVSTQRLAQAISGSVVGPVQAAEAMRGLAQNGLDVNQTFMALPTILALATAGEMSLRDAALGATGVMAAFNKNVSDLGQISDVFAKAAALSNTDVQSMVASMRQASTVGDQFGVTLEETAASLATMAKRNIVGTAAGTAFRNMMKELASPTKQAKAAIDDLGLKFYDAGGKLKPLSENLDLLKARLSTLNEESKLAFLDRIFGERGGKAANALLSDLELFKGTLDTLRHNVKGFSQEVTDALAKTTDGRFKTLLSEFQTEAARAFDGASGGLNNFIESLRQLVRADEFKNGLKALVDGVTRLTTFLLENGDAIKTLLAVWAVGRVLSVAGVAIGLLTTKVVELTAGTVALGVASKGMLASLTGGLSLIVGLGIEFAMLSRSTDQATEAERAQAKALENSNSVLDERIAKMRTENDLLARKLTLMGQGLTAAQAEKTIADEGEKKKSFDAKSYLAGKQAELAAAKAALSSGGPAYSTSNTEGDFGAYAENLTAKVARLQREVSTAQANVSKVNYNEAQAGYQKWADTEVSRITAIREFNKRVEEAKSHGIKVGDIGLSMDLKDQRISPDDFAAKLKEAETSLNALKEQRSVPSNSGDARSEDKSEVQAVIQRIHAEEAALIQATKFRKDLDAAKYNPTLFGQQISAYLAEQREIEMTTESLKLQEKAVNALREVQNLPNLKKADRTTIETEIEREEAKLDLARKSLQNQKEIADAKATDRSRQEAFDSKSKLKQLGVDDAQELAKLQTAFNVTIIDPTVAAQITAQLAVQTRYASEIQKHVDKVDEIERAIVASRERQAELTGDELDREAGTTEVLQENLSLQMTRLSIMRAQASAASTQAGAMAKGFAEESMTAEYGFNKFWADYVNSATSSAKLVEDIMKSSTDQMAKGFADFVATGKQDFKGLATSILQDITRMMANQMMQKFLMVVGNAVLGSMGGGATNGNGGYSAGGVTYNNPSAFGMAHGGVMTEYGALPLRRYAKGGVEHGPAVSIHGEGSLPEANVPLPDGRTIPVTLRGGAGGGTSVQINVINNGAPVKATQTRRETEQGTVIDLVLDAVAADMAGGGRVHDATQRRFGLNPGGTTPRY